MPANRQHPSRHLQIIAASSLGTILEWYDFSLFAFLTPVLARYFFPATHAFANVMLTYSIFAIGFFMRPIGAILFGHLGDRYGRKISLVLSILLMAIPTFLMGLLPTYQQIGIIAPVLLTLLRMCQGLSAGGESTGAVLFAIEAGQFPYRGFIGGFIWGFVGIGMLLGSIAATLVNVYIDAFPSIWRLPFLLGLITGLLGYFVRQRLPEANAFSFAQQRGHLVQFPLYDGFKHYKIPLLRIIGIFTLSALITYLIFVFMPQYAVHIISLPATQINFISTMSLAFVTLLVPFGGFLSDLLGRNTCLRWSAMGFLLLSYPLFNLIAQGSLANLIFANSVFVLLAAVFQGTVNAAVIELLPINVRYSLIAFGYNIAYSLLGGTAPILASYFVQLTDDKAAPGLYLAGGAIIAIVATMKKTKYESAWFTKEPLSRRISSH